jgi:hypothetical protein
VQHPGEEIPHSSDTAVAVFDPGGALVTGDEASVAQAVEQLKSIGRGCRTEFSGSIADLVGLGTAAASLASQHGTYVRLTARSVALLQEHGASPTGWGTIWSFVRDSNKFAGNLDFSPVSIGADQALALQTAGATLALRAAIHEVLVALERVEGKVDELRDMMHAEQIGDVLGTRAMLRPVVERIRAEGKLSETDWDAVDSIGKDTARDVERLRAHLRTQLRNVNDGWRTGQRADAATHLSDADSLLRETLALLTLAEENVALWQQIRIFHVQLDEPDHLEYTIGEARAFLADATTEDQELLDELGTVVRAVTEPRPLDGFAPWQHAELRAAREDLTSLCEWFADQRSLELAAADIKRFPSLRDSAVVAGTAGKEIARRSASSVMTLAKKIRNRSAGEVDEGNARKPELDA